MLPACASAMTCNSVGGGASSPCSGSRCSPMPQQQRQCVTGVSAHMVLSNMQPIHAAALISWGTDKSMPELSAGLSRVTG